MEYEIEDEDLLFDESTNPSLLHRAPQPSPARPSPPAGKPERQSAEHIPEEEPDHQMG